MLQEAILDSIIQANPTFVTGLAANLSCVVWATDATLRFTALTGKGLDALNIRSEEIVGLPLTALFPPDHPLSATILAVHEKALAGEPSTYESNDYHGRSYLCYLHPQRGSDGKVVGCLGLAFDVTESKLTERIVRTKYLTTKTLNETNCLSDALPPVLQAVCETMGWEYGEYFTLDPETRALRFEGAWHDDKREFEEFEPPNAGIALTSDDESLPGRVVRSGEAKWVPDVWNDPTFCRATQAEKLGLHSAVAFPVLSGSTVFGAIVFFSRRVKPPDAAVLDMMTTIGIQFGRFIERKRAKERLRANKRRFDAFMNNSPVIAFMKDAEGRYTYLNEPYKRRFAVDTDGWVGKTDADLWPPDTALRLQENDHVVLTRNEPVELEEVTPTPDGDRHWLVCKFPVPGGDGKPALGGMALDITDRKQSEAAVRLRDRAIESFIQGVCITDARLSDNPIVYVNQGFLRMTGYAHEEVMGRNCRFLQGPKTDRAVVDQVRQAVGAGQSCFVELLNYRKDGTAFWNALSISPVHDDDRILTHFVAVQTDISPLKRLEEQFRQAQKMEAVGQLAGGVSHDFNNLLTVISGYSDILLGRLPLNNPDRELIDEIHKAGERAAALTRQLLAFSRQQVLEPKVLNLNEIVADMEKMLRRLIGEDITLTTVPAPTLRPVKVDAGQVEQVILNLAVNARDAMPKGGQLTIETANVDLDEGYAVHRPEVKPGRYVLLTVSDTGTGMPPDVQARIFEPFYTTKGPGKGTGLGLATVYGIVKQSGGFIYVYSELGHGTTFKVYLPVVWERAATGESVLGLKSIPRGTETILVAEDEAGVRAIIRLALRSQGYTVLEAANGTEAVRVAEAHAGPIHLLVTDVVMPEMGGRELTERLAALRPGLKVLYLSGYTDDAVVRHGVLEAHAHFMQKPFTPAKLAAKIRQVLDE